MIKAHAVEARVLAEVESLVASGAAGDLCFNSSSNLVIQGRYYVEPIDNDETAAAKRRRQNSTALKDAFKTLTPDQFERLCGKILFLLGAQDARVTKHSRDQGIDFYGKIRLADLGVARLPFLSIEHDISLWLVGQAKHYPNGTVSTEEMREAFGSLQMATAKAFASTRDIYADLAIRVADPAVNLFFTTGRFSRDAKILTNSSGIVAKDGSDLADFLADKGVGMVGVGEELSFSHETFSHWLAS